MAEQYRAKMKKLKFNYTKVKDEHKTKRKGATGS